ncbi:hypothetical protein EDC94DRAFT_588467 [Helicostylum pulchrum]|nr:hypothetical protein EDC94DRAFT_588467 [Helicostylum pulchrum]
MKRATSKDEDDIYSDSLKRPKMQSLFEGLSLSGNSKSLFQLSDEGPHINENNGSDIIEENQSETELERTSSPTNSDAILSEFDLSFGTIYSEEEVDEEGDEEDGQEDDQDAEDAEISDFYFSDDSDEGNLGFHVFDFDIEVFLLNLLTTSMGINE